MNTRKLANLRPLNEPLQVEIQGACEAALTEVLDALAGLVIVSDMSEETRFYFMNGIGHLRGHISAETNSMQATASGRLN